MRLTITIDTDNAAFEGHAGVEAARILGRLAGYIKDDAVFVAGWGWPLLDTNGNTAGRAVVTEAHANLLVATPDLLAACRAIATLADGQGRRNLTEVAGQARAAIAKAAEAKALK